MKGGGLDGIMARLDTGWHTHPKILGLGLAAMGLHAWSISYCDHALSDGFIPSGAWPSLVGVRAAVKTLVAAGLWQATEGGYCLHDYADYNRTKAQVEAQREEDRVRKMSGRTDHRTRNGKVPDSGHDSGRNPRAPGPGPGINSRPPARQAGRIAPAGAHVREDSDFQPLGSLMTGTVPAEVLERLGRQPLGQPAEPSQPVENSVQETTEYERADG